MKEINPKQKATELIGKFLEETGRFTGGQEVHAPTHAKRCALICVEEILSLRTVHFMGRNEQSNEGDFWNKVKEEIQKP